MAMAMGRDGSQVKGVTGTEVLEVGSVGSPGEDVQVGADGKLL